MKYTTFLGAMLLVALLLTSCGSSPVTGVPTQVQPVVTAIVATATALAPTEPPAASATPETSATPVVAGTQTTTTNTPAAGVPVTGETTVKATLSDQYGPILANGDDIALYIYRKDKQNGDTSACTDTECTSEWSPLTTQGSPVAGAGAIQSLLGTITREDGTLQVTYNGWPLYLFSGDTAAGTTNGQGMDNEWTLVSPSGKAIQPK